MARAPVVHRCLSLRLISLFIDDEAVIGDNRANFIFFLFTSDAEYLVVDLDADEVFGKDFSVAKANLCGRLRCQIVNHQIVCLIVVIMQTRLVLRKDEVRLKADHIV